MSNEDKYLSVRVVQEQPIPYGNEAMAPMYRAVIAEQRAFLIGNKHVEVVSLAYKRTESEAKRRAAALLRRWASDLERPRDLSGGDPKLCSYCGNPTNSSTCQRSHP